MLAELYIIVRHCHYTGGGDSGLSAMGIRGATKVANFITTKAKGRKVKIFCSDAKRAVETADIIGDKFGLQPVITDLLHAGNSAYGDEKPAVKFIDQNEADCDVIVVVAHKPMVKELLPRAYCARAGIKFPGIGDLLYGDTVVINVSDKTFALYR